MSDPYLEAAENVLEDSDEARALVRDIIDAWKGDRTLYLVECFVHAPHGINVETRNGLAACRYGFNTDQSDSCRLSVVLVGEVSP